MTLNQNLTDEQVAELKLKFEAWQEIQERRKELTEENKAICKDAALIIDGKASDATKFFKNMAQLYDGENAEANEISLLLDKVRGVSLS